MLLAPAFADARPSRDDLGPSPVLGDDGGHVGLLTLPTGPALASLSATEAAFFRAGALRSGGI